MTEEVERVVFSNIEPKKISAFLSSPQISDATHDIHTDPPDLSIASALMHRATVPQGGVY